MNKHIFSFSALIVTLGWACPLAAQVAPNQPFIAGQTMASVFGQWSVGAQVLATAGGSGTVSPDVSSFTAPGGYQFSPFAVGVPVLISDGANTETVVILSSSCTINSNPCSFRANFAFSHLSRLQISSGSYGLQEAINATLPLGGTVVTTPDWRGTTAMIEAASGSTNVEILDQRTGVWSWYGWTGSAYQQALCVNNPPAGITCATFASGVTFNTPTLNGATLNGNVAGTPVFSGNPRFTANPYIANLSAQQVESMVYADQFGGADICAQVNAAFAAFPAGGVVVAIPTPASPTTVGYSCSIANAIVVPANDILAPIGIVQITYSGSGATTDGLTLENSITEFHTDLNSQYSGVMGTYGQLVLNMNGTGRDGVRVCGGSQWHLENVTPYDTVGNGVTLEPCGGYEWSQNGTISHVFPTRIGGDAFAFNTGPYLGVFWNNTTLYQTNTRNISGHQLSFTLSATCSGCGMNNTAMIEATFDAGGGASGTSNTTPNCIYISNPSSGSASFQNLQFIDGGCEDTHNPSSTAYVVDTDGSGVLGGGIIFQNFTGNEGFGGGTYSANAYADLLFLENNGSRDIEIANGGIELNDNGLGNAAKPFLGFYYSPAGGAGTCLEAGSGGAITLVQQNGSGCQSTPGPQLGYNQIALPSGNQFTMAGTGGNAIYFQNPGSSLFEYNTYNGQGHFLTAATAAQSGSNSAPMAFGWQGNYWTGSASAIDDCYFQPTFSTGSNPAQTLAYMCSGSSGGHTLDLHTVPTLITIPVTTVSGLSAVTASLAIVTDANSLSVGSCTGGGSDTMLAIYNGSTWSCH